MTKTLVSVAAWAFLGWLIGAWLGAATGFAVMAAGLLLMILVSGLQLSRIAAWVDDIEQPPPPSVGPWDDVLAPIYRKLKRDRHDIAALERQVESIMMAAQALPDGAITLNESMQLTWCNQTASEHAGLNPESDRGHSIFNILRAPEFARYARQTEWPTALILHINTDGQDKTLLIQLTRYGVGQYLIVTRDVTQVEKLETTRKDFVANVSHELRTPLTVLSGFLETLADMPPGSLSDEQKQRYHGLMMEQAQRMQAIVADLLTLSTLESSPTAEGGLVQMGQVVRTALQQGRVLSGDQHVFVENIDDGLCVEGVETELASAVSNLLTNAIRYTPRDGTITVSWYATEDGHACYSVQDTGIGIASQDIPRLTERFYRVDRGRSRATGGTGLGLAITKHVAMRHHAELQIQSRFGAGSIFSLVFPPSRTSRAT
ncbi:phosphate regulon sensor histidine kinase PhoR [Allopusillimonas soli]|uniref:Phosphate regulon sensor protein PhoR n=1 Tax=Allopusillimonas soli TaxID=659016 RepID=A0A853FBZ0_9BURK|nr:phosphate regulon sensor histidine kinase PhoR [Allopusillimonas soli]NYT37593.1 phosphate regulon sensor histidine kinase PhoR [Allopusillimonas soli]TEA74443.1 phosphate regulon sensor histidine kinase PhoR [Allopusillimonas soli]